MKAFSLDNGVKVLVVSDADADRAGAALAVHAGSMADGEYPGIAHFLEHMLFLGTEKYPDAGAYKDYLSANDGSSNAYTAEDHTNYFFQVKPDAFEGALDRFAQFFIAPLMTDTLSAREVNAVDSEHSKNLENDFWRRRQVWRTLLNPEHPRAGFSTGNKETLAGVKNEMLREFYDREYSANRMALCLIAPEPLSTLESWARSMFGTVPNKKLKPFRTDAPLFTDLAGSRVDVKSVRDIRELRLHFELDAASFDVDAKPGSIVGSILGHEGHESLLQNLKDAGWATALSAGPAQTSDAGTFDVTIQLTAAGLENVESVTERVFGMINLLRGGGDLPDHLIREAQRMQEIELRFRQPGEPFEEVRMFSGSMLRYPHEDLLPSMFLIRKPSQAAIRHVLEQLRPDNVTLFVNAQNVETDRVEPHYGAEYAMRPFPESLRARLAGAKPVGDMGLPAPNPFLPENFGLVAATHGAEPFVHEFRGGEIWLRHDTQFEKPKASLRVDVLNGLNQATARDFVLGQLFADAATEALNPYSYPARLAGLEVSFSSERAGLTLQAGGFSDRLDDFVEFVAPYLTDVRIDEKKFEILRERRLRELRNKVRQPASNHAFDSFRDMLREVNWNDEEQLAALEAVGFADLKDYASRAGQETWLRGFVYGNLDEKQVRRLAKTLRAELAGPRVLPAEKRFNGRVLKMAPGTSVVLSKPIQSNDSACLLVYQGDPLSEEQRAALRIASQIGGNRFFQDLRTLQQTGYIVGAAGVDIEGLPFFYFLSQSSVVDTPSLRGRFESFVKHFVDDLGELSAEEFEANRQAGIAQVLKKRTSFEEELAWNFQAAFDRKGDFEADRREAAALGALTLERYRALVPAFFSEEGVRRVSIEVVGDSARHHFQPTTLEDLRESAEGFWERPAPSATAKSEPGAM
jgi:insulysin